MGKQITTKCNLRIREHRKLRKLKHSYLTERTKQKKHFLEETAYLNNLLANNAIDLETYSRLRKLLVISYQKKREEIRKKHGFTLIYCVFRRPWALNTHTFGLIFDEDYNGWNCLLIYRLQVIHIKSRYEVLFKEKSRFF